MDKCDSGDKGIPFCADCLYGPQLNINRDPIVDKVFCLLCNI